MRTIQIRGFEFQHAEEAIRRESAADAVVAITVGDQFLVVRTAEVDRLAEQGVPFAFLSLNGAAVYMEGVAHGSSASDSEQDSESPVTVHIT